MTRSPRSRSSNYRANIADSFYDFNVSDSFDSNDEGSGEALQAFLAEKHYDDVEVDVLQAFAAFQQRRAPKKGGVRIPRDVYGPLPKEFKRGWDSLTGEQQQQVAKDSFPKNEDRQQASNSQVQVYQSHQFIPNEHVAAMYHVSQASLSYHDDSSYDIGTDHSDGESFDADDDDASTQELTVKAAKQLQRAQGAAGTNAKSKHRNRNRPPKSQLPGGSAIKMLANQASPIMRDGKVVGHMYSHTPNAPNNMQAKMAIMSYEFFSTIPCPETPVHENNDGLAATYTHTLQANKGKLEVIRALVDGGANGGIGGRDMKVIAWHPQHRKVNIGIAGDHQMTGLRLGTFAAYILTDQGPVIGIFNNYAHCPDQAQSIHSKIQLQSNGNLVSDTATVFGGLQMIQPVVARKSHYGM